MMMAPRLLASCVGVLSIAALMGCGSSPRPRLYRIEPVHQAEDGSTESNVTIAVGPIRLPEHLKRKEILYRNEPYRLTAAEFERWAEPLDDSIASALTENLSALVSTGLFVDHRWAAGRDVDYTVHVQVITFALDPDGDVRLNAAWMIASDTGISVGLQKESYRAPRSSADVVATVAAMSQAVGELSQDIADEIDELPPIPRDD